MATAGAETVLTSADGLWPCIDACSFPFQEDRGISIEIIRDGSAAVDAAVDERGRRTLGPLQGDGVTPGLGLKDVLHQPQQCRRSDKRELRSLVRGAIAIEPASQEMMASAIGDSQDRGKGTRPVRFNTEFAQAVCQDAIRDREARSGIVPAAVARNRPIRCKEPPQQLQMLFVTTGTANGDIGSCCRTIGKQETKPIGGWLGSQVVERIRQNVVGSHQVVALNAA